MKDKVEGCASNRLLLTTARYKLVVAGLLYVPSQSKIEIEWSLEKENERAKK
jgi:hypothetical protein